MHNKKLFLVVNPNILHIGGHLRRAAESLHAPFRLYNTTQAFSAPYLITKLNWWFCGHRPALLSRFSRDVVKICETFQPHVLLSTGLAPIDSKALYLIEKLGIKRINYLTDDPFNRAHYAGWFMRSLPVYDHIFNTRRANIEELRHSGCKNVSYLPFAYDPEIHCRKSPALSEEKAKFDADVVFIGGADRDRLKYINALIDAKFKVSLYGGYWERFSKTRLCHHGFADKETLPQAIAGAKIALCLVRRANRDGNSMRSFEIPAIGACMLTEDTAEHREIFGKEGENVLYFNTVDEMIKKARFLLDNKSERLRLANSAHFLILNGKNTYKDRLMAMLET